MVTEESIKQFSEQCSRIFEETGKDMIGQSEVVEDTIIALIAGGNVLLEGVPGVGKTRLVRTLSRVFNLPFSRIQFTPDLMPADVTGTNIITKDEKGNSAFRFEPGPIFANLVLADEINRATPKTQSALLEAMQEYGLREPEFCDLEIGFRINLYRKTEEEKFKIAQSELVIEDESERKHSETEKELKKSKKGAKKELKRELKDGAEIRNGILQRMQENPAITQVNLMEEFELTRKQVQIVIKDLQKNGLVERQGSRRSGRWVVMKGYITKK